jgi:hypothetical protein
MLIAPADNWAIAAEHSGIALKSTSSAGFMVLAGTSVATGASVAAGPAGASVAAGVAWAQAVRIMLAAIRRPKTVISFFMINLLHQIFLFRSCNELKSKIGSLRKSPPSLHTQGCYNFSPRIL